MENNEEVIKYIETCLNLDDCSQLYYKLIEDKLFLVYIEVGAQRDYWNENWEFLPFAFKAYENDNFDWKTSIAMGLTPEQELVSLNGHTDWPKSFPILNEMNIFFDVAKDQSHRTDERMKAIQNSYTVIGKIKDKAQQKLEEYDLLVTTIRNILTDAGIPDHEEYPDEDVDDHEKSLRTGGRMIPLAKRVQMLADRGNKDG